MVPMGSRDPSFELCYTQQSEPLRVQCYTHTWTYLPPAFNAAIDRPIILPLLSDLTTRLQFGSRRLGSTIIIEH